jgi:hypothetical protein
MQVSSALMSTITLINSIKNAINTISDDSATALEKIGAGVSAFMSASMSLNSVLALGNTLSQTSLGLKVKENLLSKASTSSKVAETAATGLAAKA